MSENGNGAMNTLSLGWGVQSFTLAAMVAIGELEPLDFAIHARTYESRATFAFKEKWTPWLESHGVKVVEVRSAQSKAQIESGKTDLPAFTINDKGSKGKLNRQCTGSWKIDPMRRYISGELRARGLKKTKGVVASWLGISLDEFQRMRDSDVRYIRNRWPLIELKMTRKDCVTWLEAHGLEVPPKSSCTFCPFHSMAEWRAVKADPVDWAEAVEVDEAVRKVRPPFDLFVHPARIPLVDVDLRTDQEKGQLDLWDEECAGVCGV